MTKFTKAQKKKLVKLYYSGTPAAEICKKHQIPHSTFYYWVEQEPIQRTKRHALINSRDYVSLLSKYKKATTEINILQEFISQIHLSRDERYKITDALYGHYSLHTLCDALQINRATYYNHLKSSDKISAREEKHAFLLSKIKDIYDSSNGTYGSDRITKVLKRNGERIGRNTVRECMLEMGLETAKTLYTKQRKLQWRSRKEARFRSQRKATAANTVWVSDLTEFFIHGKKIYICVILDAERRIYSILSALRTLESAGVHIRLRPDTPDSLNVVNIPWHFPLRLSVKELAAFMLLPYGEDEFPGTNGLHPKLTLPPKWYREPTNDIHGRTFARSRINIGSQKLSISRQDSLEHTIILGPTGSGKSTVMEHLILADINAGRSVLVIDPKADLVNSIHTIKES